MVIPFDFEYYRPETVQEAVELYQTVDKRGLSPLYFGGGTEIVSMARLNTIKTGAVIDIKAIPECKLQEIIDGKLIIGAAVTLTSLMEANLFPLLAKAGGRVADHTIRDKVTLGGNLCGKIQYREATLPLLLCDSEMILVGPQGRRTLKSMDFFQSNARLLPGELLVQVLTPTEYLSLPHAEVKKTRLDKIDYPLVTIAMVKKEGRLRVAISGLCSFPFRSEHMETELNTGQLDLAERARNSLQHLPTPIVSDIHGSAEYRAFVFHNTLLAMMQNMSEVG